VILSRQLTASILLFVRQGSWAIAITLLMAMNRNSRDLNIVMMLWACAGILTVAIGSWTVYRLQMGGWREPVDWAWLRKGIAVSGGLLIATLALRAVQTVDRYWLKDLVGVEVVGAYALFTGVAGALTVFLDAGIFSFGYPELIILGNQKQYAEMHIKVRQMLLKVIGVSLAFTLASIIILHPLLKWIGRDIYQAEIGIYYFILAGFILVSISMAPHYALYALGRDRMIIVSHLAALPVFVVTTLVFIPLSRTYAVPVGVLAAMLVILLWKTAVYLGIRHRQTRQMQSSLKAGECG
jgi:O-antigen/teichoic acid export membrane protein